MNTVGIVCEYNPLHLGHQKQINRIRSTYGEETGIVCIMSGNYVQRGVPAIFDKAVRAQAAVVCGADLVLELPVTAALSSAEGFAAAGVGFLSPICQGLCFGAETADTEKLMELVRYLLSPAFSEALRTGLDKGLSFPMARAEAIGALGLDSGLLSSPNNILAVEYCKAIITQNSPMEPLPIHRMGSYHATDADRENPSATAIRSLMLSREDWLSFVPSPVHEVFHKATLHSLSAGERGILARLKTMTEADFEALPYGSEGLWRKLMHSVRQEGTLEAIASAVKSKRYTRTRIDRMILCAFLGITAADIAAPAPYARVLAFNDRGRKILKNARNHGLYPNLGEDTALPYQDLEERADSLYGLFALQEPQANLKYRVFYKR